MTDAAHQNALELEPFANRGLFSDRFLAEMLPKWPEFAEADPRPLLDGLRTLWAAERPGLIEAGANEGQTEERWIRPVLRALGFSYTVFPSIAVAGRRREPDYALYVDEPARRESELLEGDARFSQAVCVADAKRWGRPLDERRPGGALSEDPVAQITYYVYATRCPFGLLTNGRHWRIYARNRNLLGAACFEIDLEALIEADDPGAFRWFSVLFSASAFSSGPGGSSLLDRALEESVQRAVEVGEGLQAQVFGAVPLIAQGLLGDEERTEETLADAFDHALVLLYRLLFCLYAEARGLLPADNPHYREYGLRKQTEALAEARAAGRVYSRQSDDLYNDLRALFRIVDRGDPGLGVAEYNGGLFSPSRHPYFEGRFVADDLLAPALDRLYRVGGEFVDYRDLSARHLGEIYERLLDYRLVDDAGSLRLESASGRKESGSYYTPEAIVDRIVERTLDPLLDERSRAVAHEGATGEDALARFLELRVLDPAMGSGHFLVAAGQRIAQYVATDPSYLDGELSWEEIQRRVAERCIYGLDLNPMAVELAQLSLWLSTARQDEPLTFLGNLRVGNALVGSDVRELLAGGDSLFAEQLARDTGEMLDRVGDIAGRPSSAGGDVHAKETLAETVAALREPLERHADEAIAPAFSGTDPMAFHWELEFPEAFLEQDGTPRPDGGFDAVIGNPPYIRIQATDRQLAQWCRKRYRTASGSFDTYVPFIERGLELLQPGGRLGFIVPNKLTKLDYATRLREWLSADGLAEEIIDFGDAQLFAGATNYTCILLLDRAGRSELTYRRVERDPEKLTDVLESLDRAPAQSFELQTLGSDPWVLATGEEARLLGYLRERCERLDEVTTQIFQGLITSADPIYVLADRGMRGGRRVVYSKALDAELELEPELLHPLASGVDVERYAFRPLGSLLLFPYQRDDGAMRLLTPEELASLPLTAAYLGEHETALRGRERGAMDHAGWYAFGRTQSLGAHDLPKLGVAATVQHLEVGADPAGEIYFHNVRVNGILIRPEGPTIWTLLALLNSRIVDWVFRRGAAVHANGYFAANKQFIAPLPIRVPDAAMASQLDPLSRRLHDFTAELLRERRGFLAWLSDTLGARTEELPGATLLAGYDDLTLQDLLEVLRKSRAKLGDRVESRAFRDLLDREHAQSSERVAERRRELATAEGQARELVLDLYELTASQRSLVASDFE